MGPSGDPRSHSVVMRLRLVRADLHPLTAPIEAGPAGIHTAGPQRCVVRAARGRLSPLREPPWPAAALQSHVRLPPEQQRARFSRGAVRTSEITRLRVSQLQWVAAQPGREAGGFLGSEDPRGQTPPRSSSSRLRVRQVACALCRFTLCDLQEVGTVIGRYFSAEATAE